MDREHTSEAAVFEDGAALSCSTSDARDVRRASYPTGAVARRPEGFSDRNTSSISGISLLLSKKNQRRGASQRLDTTRD